jgi:hypothetical protein
MRAEAQYLGERYNARNNSNKIDIPTLFQKAGAPVRAAGIISFTLFHQSADTIASTPLWTLKRGTRASG